MDADCYCCSHSLTWHGAWLLLRSAFIFRMVALPTMDVSLSLSFFLRLSTRLVKGLYRLPIQLKRFPSTIAVSMSFCLTQDLADLCFLEVGMSFSVATNLFWAGILTVVFPHLMDILGPTGVLGLFAGFNIVALVMIFLWVPETAQRTLEELDYICEW